MNPRPLLFAILVTSPTLLPTTTQASDVRALLIPEVEAVLSSEMAGRIVSLPIKEGQRINKGQLLAAFDCTIPKARLVKAKAELSGAEKSLESNRKLSQLGSFSSLDLALSESKRDEVKAVVSEASALIQRCSLYAPFDGRVVDRMVNNYESVSQGQQMIALLDDTSLRLTLFVPSNWLRWIKVGKRFEVLIGETGKSYPAIVQGIGARVDAVSQSIELYGKVDGTYPELLAGMSGEAMFDIPAAE